jgi:hypothetical protein
MMPEGPIPVVISGAPRSGTTLLYNLFDGHPDISWLVTEGYFFEYLYDTGIEHGWIYAALAAGGIDQLVEGIRDRDVLPRVHGGYRQVNAGTMQTAIEYEVPWSEAAFRQSLASGSYGSAQELWSTLARACLAGLGEAERRYVCLKSPDYGKSAFAALTTLPSAKAIILLRDPLAAIDSLKFTRAKRKTKLLTWPTLAIVIGNYLRMLEQSARQPRERLKIVRYEDLVEATEATMRDVAAWLGVPFLPSLTVPSFQGRSWSGHSSRRLTDGGIDRGLAGREVEHLTANERRVIVEALAGPMAAHGYDLKHQQ